MPRPRLSPDKSERLSLKIPPGEKAEWEADARAATPPGEITNLSSWVRAVVNESRAWRRNFRTASPPLPPEPTPAPRPDADGSTQAVLDFPAPNPEPETR